MKYKIALFCSLSTAGLLFSQTQQLSNSCFEIAMGASCDIYHHSLLNQGLREQALSDSVNAYSFRAKPGLHFGFLKSFEISEQVLIRTGLTASMATANYRFASQNKDNFEGHLNVKSQVLAFTIPLHGIYNLKLSKKRNRSYPYLVAGGFYAYQSQTASTRLSGRRSTAIMINNQQAGIDLGIGGRLFSKNKYLFAPELKYRIGLVNMKALYNDPYNKLFDMLKMQSIILTLHFS